jgi:methionyl-tRNA formyltransferase
VAERALRIVLCTNGGLHGALVLDRLLASPHAEVVGVVLSSRTLRASQGFLAGALGHIRRSGLPYATYLWCSTSLADLVLRFSPTSPVPIRASRQGIPTWTTRRVNDAASRAFIEGRSPDLIVSAFFNQRIAEDVACVPRLGAVNIHPSALPEFKGVDPVFFAKLRDGPLGVSVHRIAPELDCGEIIARETLISPPGESVLAATARLFDRGADLLTRALTDIQSGKRGTPQPPGGTYDSWPTRSTVAALHARGSHLMRWSDLQRPRARSGQ